MWPVSTVGTDGSIKGRFSLDRKLHLRMKLLTETRVFITIFIYDQRKTEYSQIEKKLFTLIKTRKKQEGLSKRILLKQRDSWQTGKCEGSGLNDSPASLVWKCNAATKALHPCSV